MKTLRKYLRIYAAFFKASFVADLEFRANFITRIATDIFWYIAQIGTFETLYRHTGKIGGWDINQTRVFLGVLFVVDALYMITLHDNLDRLSDRVRRGDMDLLLVKPINSQFMLSFQRAATALFGNLLIGIAWLSWSLYHLPDFQPVQILWLLVLIPTGLAALYAMRFMFAATTVIFTKSDNLQYVWYQIYKLGMRPDTIYFPWLKFLITTLFPVAFIASVPAQSLMFPTNWKLFVWAPLWTIVLVWLSSRFWRFCLRFYTSASS